MLAPDDVEELVEPLDEEGPLDEGELLGEPELTEPDVDDDRPEVGGLFGEPPLHPAKTTASNTKASIRMGPLGRANAPETRILMIIDTDCSALPRFESGQRAMAVPLSCDAEK
jgi:hypothetical protein